MVIMLGIIAALIFASVAYLVKFMRDMAVVESRIISELVEMKNYLKKMSEK
jgi:hypothetical protein